MPPNILLVFPDQWRGDWVGAISDLPLCTPNVDALLARGTGFARAWTPSPLCAPARSCLATGQAYGRAPVMDNFTATPLDRPTLYGKLREAGYQVASIGKSDLLKSGLGWGGDGRHMLDGEDRMAMLGFSHGADSAGKHDSVKAADRGLAEPYTAALRKAGMLELYVADMKKRSAVPDAIRTLAQSLTALDDPPDAYRNTAESVLPEALYLDNFIGQAALNQLSTFDTGQPWFAMVNFAGPHEPMDITMAMEERWRDVVFPTPDGAANPTLHLDIRRRYAAMMEVIDGWLGRFVAHLEASGQAENTVVVFASDHGEMLGDRNLWQKQVPFEPSVHVPLILAGPGIAVRGIAGGAPANLLDLVPTFLHWAGAEPLPGADGHDLAAWLAESESCEGQGSRDAASGLGAWRAITDGRQKLVVGLDLSVPQGRLQLGRFDPACLERGALYDLDADPFEQTDLWDSEPGIRDELLRRLVEYYDLPVPENVARRIYPDERAVSQARTS